METLLITPEERDLIKTALRLYHSQAITSKSWLDKAGIKDSNTNRVIKDTAALLDHLESKTRSV